MPAFFHPPAPLRSPARPGAPARRRRRGGAVSHEVDYEPESPKIREMARKKATRRGFKLAVVLIGCICLAALLRITIREAFLKNPQFALRQMVVKTEGSLPVAKIVRATGLTEGTNLLTINMRELRAKIERLPQVKWVALERDYAGRLTVMVEQRRPVAWLECQKLGFGPPRAGMGGHLLDAEGVVFPCDDTAEGLAALPVVRYEQLSQGTYGAPVPDFQVKVALDLLARLQDRFDQGPEEPRLIDIQTPYSMAVTFGHGTEVTFGVDDIDLQLTRLDRVRAEARQRQWQIATLNLLVRENVPVTFRQAPDLTGLQDAAPAVPIRTANLTTSRSVR